MKKRPWSILDVAKLRQLYPDATAKSIAKTMNRKIHEIYAKAQSLGLKKSPEFLASPLSGRITKGNGKPYSNREIRVVTAMFTDHSSQEVADKLKCSLIRVRSLAKKLGLKKSAAFMASEKSGRLLVGDQRGAKTRFHKGHIPWTKGKKGLRVGVATEFKKGQMPHNHLPVGTVVMATIGYLKVKVAEPNKWRFLHRLNWEKANGPVPKGMLLTFKDKNHENCAVDNLELVAREDHMKRHTIQRFPEDVKQAIRLVGKLKRTIKKRESAHG